ncbi:hypothetical protein TRFO_01639 [Tritrichomonas foetus]|uniref:Uncharacterized protein n=1 Tax=Tritrichomonas foetus TaxID=1144522 RepID=A0A1J4JQP3_9EUKA|nr:hypothetical protein TRFO_01639 [Tritrichomonas foetus]|eukprot:OHT01074.1 hypothetical protein TRFO_01639 [Tritrichomonas foetus]
MSEHHEHKHHSHHLPYDFQIIVNGFSTKVNKGKVSSYSRTIKEFCESNPKADRIQIQIEMKTIEPYQLLIKNILSNDKKITVKYSNLTFIQKFLDKIKFEYLEIKLNEFYEKYSKPVDNSPELRELVTLERIVFTLNEDTKDNIFIETSRILNKNNLEPYLITFLGRCLSKPQDIVFLIDFLIALNEKPIERKTKLVLPIFKQIVLRNLRLKIDKDFFYDRTHLQELSFLTIWLIEKKIVEPNEIYPCYSKLPPFFAHLMNPNTMHFDVPFHSLNVNWEEHKHNILIGETEKDTLLKILREDDAKSLLPLTQYHFNFEALVQIPYYEKNSILLNNKVYIIEYCAFYGSIECFKVLLNNGATKLRKETAIFASAGGNIEILKMMQMCTCYDSLKWDCDLCLKTAIMYHKQDIVEWLVEYRSIDLQAAIKTISTAIFESGNITCFMYIVKRGVCDSCLLEMASLYGYTNVVKFLLTFANENISNYKNPLHNACLSGNEETVKTLLSTKIFNISEKTVSLKILSKNC